MRILSTVSPAGPKAYPIQKTKGDRMSRAFVSVIIPTYNRDKYIGQALDSVLSQTYQDFEIIVVDDGSIDSTGEVLQRYIRKNPGRIRYYYKNNGGPASARNLGIRFSKGSYIAFLDSDDLWLPRKLERSIRFLKSHGFDWICTACVKVWNTRRGKGKTKLLYISDQYLDSAGKRVSLLKNGLFFFSSVPLYTCSVLIRKQCFDKVGLFDETLRIGEDTDMWLRLEEAGMRGGYLREALFVYRVNDSSITRKARGARDHIRLAEKHAKILGLGDPVIRKSYSELLWWFSDICATSGMYREFLKCFLKSWYLHPTKAKVRKCVYLVWSWLRKSL